MGTDELRWSTFAIPDSAPDIELARLRVDDDGAFTVLVRFPPGWERPIVGSYDAAEEALVLEGRLEMSGRWHEPGEVARWGVDYTRRSTSAPDGALVFAWFSGPNRWTRGATTTSEPDAAMPWRDAPTVDLGDLGRPHVAWDRDDVSVLIWEALPTGATTAADIELFAIDARTFHHVPAASPWPDLEGPVLGRVRGPVHALR